MKSLQFFSCLFLFSLLATPELHAAITVDGDLSQVAVIQPGETHEGIIMLRNLGALSAEVRVYQADYTFTSDGKTFYGNPGENPRSNATWFFIRPDRLTIAPRSTAPVYYTVKAPDNQEMTGSYWSIVMIEEIPEASRVSSTQQKKGAGLTAVMRYGVQIITEVGETGTTSLRFPDKQLVVSEGKTMFQIDLENDGTRWYIPELWIEVYDMNGNSAGRFDGGKKRIFPGCSVRHLIDISSLPSGKYRVIVIADTGNENVYGAEYTLDLKE